jgi:hypothetical protein
MAEQRINGQALRGRAHRLVKETKRLANAVQQAPAPDPAPDWFSTTLKE